MKTKELKLTRTIPRSLAGVLEQLELERPEVVTANDLTVVLQELGITTPTRVVAARLRERGWLLATDRNGVWEFAPAALAGPYSSNDPLLPIRTFLTQYPQVSCALTFQAGAWAHGIADRLPNRPEVAVTSSKYSKRFFDNLAISVFAPALEHVETRGVSVLAPESIIVNMTAKPMDVRSWQSALEWLPGLASDLDGARLDTELQGRSKTIIARTGYLLQGLRPDISAQLYRVSCPTTKTWFGSRGSLRHHDNYWLVADTILPFDPRDLERVK